MDKLEKSKMVISNIIQKNLNDYDTSGEYIKKLRETLELSIEEKKEFISKTILRKFPGRFGESFVAMYEPFLKISIETEEKKSVWLKLVELLDDMNEVDENSHFVKWYDNKEEADVEKHKESTNRIVERILLKGISKDDIEKEGKQLIELLKNNKFRDKLNETLTIAREEKGIIGEIREQLDEYLSLLNDDYKIYIENCKNIVMETNKEVINQSGLGIEELMQKFNVIEKK